MEPAVFLVVVSLKLHLMNLLLYARRFAKHCYLSMKRLITARHDYIINSNVINATLIEHKPESVAHARKYNCLVRGSA